MAAAVNVPKLGVSMTEAVLSSWTVKDGDTVSAGDVICTIETDKVEQDIEAPAAGVLVHRAEPGATYLVGELLAEIE